MAEVISQCYLIVFDECTMILKRVLEANDRMLRDIRNTQSLLGVVTVALSEDFRQILPVLQKGTKTDEISKMLEIFQIFSHVENEAAYLVTDNNLVARWQQNNKQILPEQN